MKLRLAVNGVACTAIAVLCWFIALPGLAGLVSGSLRMGADPDGADKVLLAQIFAAVVAVIATVSLVRTVRAWRRLAKP